MNPLHYELSHLETLEAEAIHIFREVAAEFERPVLLFSGLKTVQSRETAGPSHPLQNFRMYCCELSLQR